MVTIASQKMEAILFLSKSTSGIYYLYYTASNGKRNKVSTHASLKSEALRFLQSFQETEKKKRCKTLSEFLTDFYEYVQSNYNIRTFYIYRDTVNHFLNIIPDSARLDTITAKHWDLFKTFRLRTVSPVTVNIELRTLNAMMNTALRWEEIKSNPFHKCQKCAIAEKNPDYINEDDFANLINSIQESWLKELAIFTVLTGLRRGEVTNLLWDNINIDKKVMTIISSPSFKTKGGRKRVISLNDSAIFILKQKYINKCSEYVFTLNRKKIDGDWMSKKFGKYIRKLNLKGKICFHTLRHTFSSWLVMKGISIYSVSKLLGHSSVVTTQRYYAHLQPDELHEQVNSISFHLN